MSAAAKVVSSPPPAADAIRVMVVDDSVVVRGLVTRWLGEESNISVVASARTGRDAVDQVERANPDVVILDVEMPELDGLSALPLLLAKKRDLVVIMASTLTLRNAEISLKALALGASDYLPKPESNRGVTTSTEFRRELIEKVTTLGAKRLKRRARPTAAGPASAPPAAPRTVRTGAAPAPGGATALSSAAAERKTAIADPVPLLTPGAPIVLRPGMVRNPRVLLVGSSTGGPQALTALVSAIGPVIDRVPVMIVQHMPPTFTTILAEHLARASGRVVREPKDGEPIVPGVVHLAPGGRHMLAVRRDGNPVVRLDDGPPVNFCRPAVDCLFHSAVSIWGGSALAVILTGMGHDGTQGARELVNAGASVLAQDEATSVVWGMPGTVAQAGLCSAVLPIDQIGPKVVRIFSGDVS